MNQTFDAVVVGAGVIGCSVAYHLTDAGLKTALLDQNRVGAGASGANFGMVQSDDVELDHSIPMVTIGNSRFDQLEEELGCSFDFRRIGTLSLISSENQWEILKRRQKVMNPAGIICELVPANCVPEIEPMLTSQNLLGALYSPYQGLLNPFHLMWAYLRRAIQRGLSLHTYTRVTDFDVQGGHLLGVYTDHGRFSAGMTVLATGAWTKRLGKMLGRNWKIHTFGGSAMVTEPVGDLRLRNIVGSAAYLDMIDGDQIDYEWGTLAISQTQEGHFLLAQASRPGNDVSSTISYLAPKLIATEVCRYFPMLRDVRVMRGWTAPTTVTDDGCPFFGSIADLSGFILASAFRSSIVNSPLVGETVAQLVVNGCSDLDISHFSPDREIKYAN